MKIGNTPEPLRSDRLTPAPTESRSAVGKTASGSGSGSGEVTKTAGATLAPSLNQLGAKLGTADFNSGKVDEVKSAISDGRFKVNSGVVADGLLASASELASKRG